jgi:hypothetical protein
MITVYFNQVLDVHLKMNNIALGNHMFQYALCRLVAEKNGYNFFIPYSGYLKECFPSIDLGIKDGDIKYKFDDHPEQIYNPNVFSIPDFTHLNGYFQTEKYFAGNEETIKSWFMVEMDDITKSVLEKYPVDKYCYVHVRGGDNKFGENNWLIPKEYYLKSFEKIKETNKDISFLIITDDVEFSKTYFPNIEVISNSIMVDFKCLYFSKYTIISASTFSWWAAWLTDKKIVLAPNKWLNYNKPENDWFFPKDVKSSKFIYL